MHTSVKARTKVNPKLSVGTSVLPVVAMPTLSVNTENCSETHASINTYNTYNTYNNWNVQRLVDHMLFSPETQHIPDDKIASIYLKGDHTLGGKPLTHFEGPESGHVFEALCFAAITSGFSDFGAVRPLKGNINIKHSLNFYEPHENPYERKVKQGSASGYSDITFVKDDKFFAGNINRNQKVRNSIKMIKNTVRRMSAKKKDLLLYIDSMLKPKLTEKKNHGEVFTPFELVEDMLNRLPSQLWSNPNLTWFDPAVGIGNFMVGVYYRLMKGLEKVIPEKDKRHKHIITKMLYMSEFNAKNVYICKMMFKTPDGTPINIHHGDSMHLNTERVWGISSFDVVVGNPPFSGQTEEGVMIHCLYGKFIERAIHKWVKYQTGYLCFVHPSIWRQYDHALFRLLSSLQIFYIEIHSKKDGIEMFNCATRFDWYVLQNRPVNGPTRIRDQLNKVHEIDLRHWRFIPNSNYSMVQSMLARGDQPLVKILHDNVYNPRTNIKNITGIPSPEFPFPIVHSVLKDNKVVYVYANFKKDHHFVPKVICRMLGEINGAISDTKGEFGVSTDSFAIVAPPDEHAEIIREVMTQRFRTIMDAISIRTKTNINVLRMFRDGFWRRNPRRGRSESDDFSSFTGPNS